MRILILIAVVLAIIIPIGHNFFEKAKLKDALFSAVRAEDEKAIVKALKHGASLTSHDGAGQTALHVAAYNASPKLVKFLIEQKAPIHEPDRRGAIALHWAAINGKLDNAEVLLNAGSNINYQDNSGATPLYWALTGVTTFEVEKFAMGAFLLNKGAKPLIKDERGQTVLDLMRKKKQGNLVNLLEQAIQK